MRLGRIAAMALDLNARDVLKNPLDCYPIKRSSVWMMSPSNKSTNLCLRMQIILNQKQQTHLSTYQHRTNKTRTWILTNCWGWSPGKTMKMRGFCLRKNRKIQKELLLPTTSLTFESRFWSSLLCYISIRGWLKLSISLEFANNIFLSI